jgi:predicted dehydrogenase
MDTIVVGAGNMGAKWLRAVRDHPTARPVALVDLDVSRARAVADDAGVGDIAVGADLAAVADAVRAAAVVDATIPGAHRDVTVTALRHGLAVLGEKPAAESLAEALALAAFAEITGHRFVVSQSRRFNRHLTAVRAWLDTGVTVGGASVRFSRGPRFGGFRDEMPSPMLVDMAIHLFDMGRWITGSTPRAVYARESNPPWSWYRGDASARAIIEFDGSVDVVFDGTWAGLGADTSWNGEWRIATDRGTLVWDGDSPATVQIDPGEPAVELTTTQDVRESLPGSLDAFVAALDSDDPVENDIDDNILSLVIVEAALASSASGERVDVADLIVSAAAQARANARAWGIPEIESVIEGWADPAARFGARL